MKTTSLVRVPDKIVDYHGMTVAVPLLEESENDTEKALTIFRARVFDLLVASLREKILAGGRHIDHTSLASATHFEVVQADVFDPLGGLDGLLSRAQTLDSFPDHAAVAIDHLADTMPHASAGYGIGKGKLLSVSEQYTPGRIAARIKRIFEITGKFQTAFGQDIDYLVYGFNDSRGQAKLHDLPKNLGRELGMTCTSIPAVPRGQDGKGYHPAALIVRKNNSVFPGHGN